jgi:hypothetical protein
MRWLKRWFSSPSRGHGPVSPALRRVPTSRVMTMSQPDDPSADNLDLEKFIDDFERHQSAIYDCLSDYMDEHSINPFYAAHVLMDVVIGLRMTSYGTTAENPSVAGLKLESRSLPRRGRCHRARSREERRSLYPRGQDSPHGG